MHKESAGSNQVNNNPQGAHTPAQWALRPLACGVRTALMAGAGALMFNGVANAGPQGGQVTRGSGQIERPDAHTTLINQRSSAMVVDWQSFNVAQQELVRFNQPGAQAAVLNNIHDQNPSQILGRLEGNGRVFLANPNGVIFGKTATVDLGSLVATTFGADSDEFMAGRYHFEETGSQGVVVNQGVLQAATGGSITLLGNRVENSGVIRAKLGQVNLASGRVATLDFDGDGLLQLRVDEEALASGDGTQNAIDNSGQILADGGTVYLTAAVARDGFKNAVNHSGIIEAARIDNHGGVIRLSGGADVRVSGTLDVSADASSDRGGRVEVLGDRVALTGQAVIDASGVNGGGTVLIGGDYQGKNPGIQNARQTYVGRGASIKADAVENGDGGKVIVWADNTTQYYGDISARGGAEGGDGGFVEVSGKAALDFRGQVATGAINGSVGTLLLDPTDITIQAGGSTDIESSVNSGTEAFQEIDPSDSSILTVADLTDALADNNVVVTTGSLANGIGNITVNSDVALSWSSGNDLTLDADNAINLIAGSNITANHSAADLVLDAAASNIDINGTINMGGSVALIAGNNIFEGGAASINTQALSVNAGGTASLNSSSNAINDLAAITVGGDLTLRNNAAITDSGDINVTGKATLNAGVNAITLGESGESTNFGSLDLTGGAINVTEGSATELTGVSATSLDLSSGGAITDSGTIAVSGQATLNAGGNAITLGESGESTNFGSLDLTGGAINVTEDSATELTGVSATSLDLSSGGAITDSGTIAVSGQATLNAGGNTITLGESGESTNFGSLDLTGGAINVTEDSATELVGVSATSLDLNSGGSITDSGTIAVSGQATLNAAGNAITLGESGESTNFGSLDLSGGAINVTEDSATELAGVSATSLDLNSGGAITDSGTIAVSGQATLNAGGNAITLGESGESTNFGSLDLTGGAINVTEDSATELAGVSATSLDLSSAGAITQSGALTVTGAAGFTVTTLGSDILLHSQANDIGGAVTLSGGANIRDLGLRNTNALAALPDFTGMSTLRDLTLQFDNAAIALPTLSMTGDLSVTAGGAITQGGALVVDGAGQSASFDALGNSVTLNHADNDFTSVAVTGADVTLNDTDDLNLAASAVSGDLNVTAGGAITQSGALVVNGAGKSASFSAAGSSITLEEGGNDFTSVALAGAGASVVDSNDLSLATSTLDGDLTVATGGTLSQSGVITAGGVGRFSSTGDTTLGLANNIAELGDVTVTGGSFTFANGNNDLNVTGVVETRNDAGGDVLINVGSGVLTTSPGSVIRSMKQSNITAQAGGTVTLVADSMTLLSGDSSIRSGGKVEVMTSSAGRRAETDTDATAAYDDSDSELNLNEAEWDALDGKGKTRVSAGGNILIGQKTINKNVEYESVGSIDVAAGLAPGSVVVDGSGQHRVTFIAGGTIGASGNLLVDVAEVVVSSSAGNVALVDAGTTDTSWAITTGGAGDISITQQGSSNLDLAGIDTDGELSVSSGGAITDSGNIDVLGRATLNAGSNAITLGDAGESTNFGSLDLTGGAVTISEDSATELVAVTAASLDLNSAGAITDSGDIAVTGAAVLNAGANAITLGDAGENTHFGSLGLNGGAVSVTEDSATELADSNVASLDLTSAGSITQSGALTVAGGADFSFTSAASDLLLHTQANSIAGTVALTGATNLRDIGLRNVHVGASLPDLSAASGLRNLTLQFDNAAIQLPSLNVGGDLSVTAGGAITDGVVTALLVGGQATLDAGANAITLGDDDITHFGSLSLTGGNVTVSEDSATELAGADVTSLNLSSAGSITQSGALNVTNTADFTVGGPSADILLHTQANSIAGTVTLNGGGAIRDIGLRNTHAAPGLPNLAGMGNLRNLTLQFDNAAMVLPSISITGDLNASAGGAITDQSGVTLSVDGLATFNAGANAITLGNDDSVHFGSLSLTGGNVSISEDSATELAGVTASSLNLTSGGAITDTGTMAVSGQATLNAGTAAITLGGAGQTTDFGSLDLTGGALTIDEDSATELAGVTATSLNLTSGGEITDTGNIAVSGQATLNAGASAITLGDAGEASNFGSLQLTGGTVTIDEDSSTDLAAVTASSLTLTSAGDITDSGHIVVVDTATLNAGGNTITLGGDTEITHFGSLGLTAATATIDEDSATDLAAISVNTLNLTSAGDITDSGDIAVLNTATLNAGANAITLGESGESSNFGSLDLTGGAVTITEGSATDLAGVSATSLNLTSSGAITDSGDIVVAGDAAFDAGGNAITLGEAGETTHFGSLGLNGGTVTVSEDSATELSGVSATILTLSSAGAITDSGDSAVAGRATLQAGGNGITLGGAGQTTHFGSLDLAGGALTIDEDSATELAALSASSLNLTSGGDITDSGDINVSGAAVLDAGGNAITLGEAGETTHFGSLGLNGGAVTVSEDSATELTDSNVASLDLTSAGSVTQSGALIVAGGADFSFTNPTSDLLLHTQANSIAGAVTLNGATNLRDIGLRNSHAAAALPDLSAASGLRNLTLQFDSAAIQLPSLSVAGDLSVSAGGAITDRAGTTLTVSGLATLDAGTSAITLGNDDTTHFGSLNLTGGVVTISEDSATELAGVSATTLYLTSAGDITDSGDIAVGGQATLNAGANAITLGGVGETTNFGSLDLTAATVIIDEDGATELAAVNATALNLTSAGDITDSGNIAVSGKATLNSSGNAITLGSAGETTHFGSLDLAGGTITVSEDSATELAGVSASSLNLTSAGTITDSGDIAVSGNATLNAGANAITLGGAGESTHFGSLELTGGTVTVDEDSATELAGVSAATLNLTSAGAITDSGDIAVSGRATLDAGGNAIALGGAGESTHFGSLDLSGGAITIAEDSATELAGLSAATLNLTSSGDITQSAAATVTGTATLSGSNIVLDAAGNDFASVGIAGANDVVLVDANALVLTGASVSGDLSVTTRGALTQSGALINRGAQSVATFVAPNQSVTLAAAGNDFRKVSLFAKEVSLYDANSLILGDSTIAGNLTVNLGGDLSDQSNISVGGAATLVAGGNILLGDQTGDTTHFGSLDVRGIDVNISEDSGMLIAGADAERLTLVSETGSIVAMNGVSLNANSVLSLRAAEDLGSPQSHLNLIFDPSGILTLSGRALYLSAATETLIASANNTSVSGKVVSSSGQAAVDAALQDFLKYLFSVDEALFNELVTIFAISEEGISLPEDQQDNDLVFLHRDGKKIGRLENIDRLAANFLIWQRYGRIFSFQSASNFDPINAGTVDRNAKEGLLGSISS